MDNDGDIRVPCNKCNGALHHLALGDIDEAGVMITPPWWICQDETKTLSKGDVIEVIYLDGTVAVLEFNG